MNGGDGSGGGGGRGRVGGGRGGQGGLRGWGVSGISGWPGSGGGGGQLFRYTNPLLSSRFNMNTFRRPEQGRLGYTVPTIPNNRRVGTGSQQTSSGWNLVRNRFQQQRASTGGMARVLPWLRYGCRG